MAIQEITKSRFTEKRGMKLAHYSVEIRCAIPICSGSVPIVIFMKEDLNPSLSPGGLRVVGTSFGQCLECGVGMGVTKETLSKILLGDG